MTLPAQEPTGPDFADLVNSMEAARLLGRDRSTFNKWVAAGTIKPAYTMPGRTGARLYSRAAILNFRQRLDEGLPAVVLDDDDLGDL